VCGFVWSVEKKMIEGFVYILGFLILHSAYTKIKCDGRSCRVLEN